MEIERDRDREIARENSRSDEMEREALDVLYQDGLFYGHAEFQKFIDSPQGKKALWHKMRTLEDVSQLKQSTNKPSNE